MNSDISDRLIALLESNNKLLSEIRDGITYLIQNESPHSISNEFAIDAVKQSAHLSEMLAGARAKHLHESRNDQRELDAMLQFHANFFGYEKGTLTTDGENHSFSLFDYLKRRYQDRNQTRRKDRFFLDCTVASKASGKPKPQAVSKLISGLKEREIAVDADELFEIENFFEENLLTRLKGEEFTNRVQKAREKHN